MSSNESVLGVNFYGTAFEHARSFNDVLMC